MQGEDLIDLIQASVANDHEQGIVLHDLDIVKLGDGQLGEIGWAVAISEMGWLSAKSSRWSWTEPYQTWTMRRWA